MCCWWQCSSSRVAPHLTDGGPGGQLEETGVNAAIVTTGGGVSNEFCAIDDDLGKYSHLFCAPEALISSRWREALVRARART